MINLLSEYKLAFGDIPVQPDYRQVLYVENHYNPVLEQYIHKNYDKLVKLFRSFNLEFLYIPELTTRMSDAEFNRLASYYCPWLKKEDLDSLRFACEIKLQNLVSEVNCKDDKPALVSQHGKAYIIDVSKPELFDALFYQIAEAYGKYYSSLHIDCCIPEEYLAEMSAINDIHRETINSSDGNLDLLFNQVKQVFPEWAIREVLYKMLKEHEVISSIVISEQGRIFLPEYNNIEIKLLPKEKAVYFLFLKHPEGIVLKNLPDYREELARYYRRVAKSDNKQAIEDAIDNMINVISGDVYVQCSRIKRTIDKAIIDQFSAYYARWYVIDGTRGLEMKINLPREKVIWELDI